MILPTLFLKILNMSITASYVILAVIFVRFLLKKAPKKYSYALWSVVLFRLCCPFSFTSVFSLFSLKLFDMTAAQQSAGHTLDYIPSDIGMAADPNISVGIPFANHFINDMVPSATVGDSVNPMQVYELIGSIIWIIGAAILIIYGVVTCVALYRKMRIATKLDDNVYLSNAVASPFVLGFIKPRIFIPYGLDENTASYILAHERYHIKRLDHIIKPLCFLVLSVYWFNPLCWIGFILMSRDMEMSCDEKVLAGEKNIRKSYSTTLLSFATGKRFPAPSPLSFGETGIKSRIKNILDWKKPKLWITISAIVVILAVALVCIANPLDEKLPDIFDKNYRVSEVTFDSALSSTSQIIDYNTPYYSFTSDTVIFTLRTTDKEWKQQGVADKLVKLTEENFDNWFIGGFSTDIFKKLRLENDKAVEVRNGEDKVAYILHQKNGDVYYVTNVYINKLEQTGDIGTLNDVVALKYNVESAVIKHNNPLGSEYTLSNYAINRLLDELSPLKDKFTEGRIMQKTEYPIGGNTITLEITQNADDGNVIVHKVSFIDGYIIGYNNKLYRFVDHPEVFNIVRSLAYDGTIPLYIAEVEPYQIVFADLDNDSKDEYIALGKGVANDSAHYVAAYKENGNGYRLLWSYGMWNTFDEGTHLELEDGKVYLITKPLGQESQNKYLVTADERGVVLYEEDSPTDDFTMIFDIKTYNSKQTFAK